MDFTKLQSFNKVFPLYVEKYELFGVDENSSITEKINSMVQALNRFGRLSNDVVKDWNKVMEWAMGEGLDVSVDKKVEAMILSGKFDEILQTSLTEFNGRVDIVETQLADIATIKSSSELVNVLTVANVSNKVINLNSNTTYTLASTLIVTNGQNIIINGNGATIDGGIRFSGTYAKNITIRDVNFTTTQNTDLVKFIVEMENIKFERCKFVQNSLTYGGLDAGLLYFNSGTYNINGLTVTNCKFTSNANTNFKVGVKLQGVNTTNFANNIKIAYCDFDDFKGFGIESNIGNGVNISHCRFNKNDGATASGSAGISMVKVNDLSVSECRFIDCGWGIETTGQKINIEDCKFTGTTNKWNIIVDADTTDLFVTDCKFYGGVIGTSGTATSINNINIDNCKFLSNASIEWGIVVNGVLLTNSNFKGTGQFYWYSVNVLLTGVIIKSNTVDTTGLTNTQYTFRFHASQNKEEVTMIDNEVLGVYGLGDVRTVETESKNKSHSTIGGYNNFVYTNKVRGSITSTQKGFILTIDKNANGGVPQGYIKLYASMYNANNASTLGEYRLSLGTYSLATGGALSYSIVNTNFGDLTVSTADAGNGQINISVTFGTSTNITDTLYLFFEIFGVNNNRIVYRGLTGIAKP